MAYTTIDDPEAYFQVKLYTGTGSELVNTLDGDTDMQPDLVWVKERSDTAYHILIDAVRGVTKQLYPNSTDDEETVAEGLKSFNTDGFTLGTDADWNTSSETYVAWCWKESATAGFDITTWTGNATNRTISHNLSVAPRMLIIKNTSTTDNWFVYHEGMGNNTYMHLETTNAGLSPSTNQFQATTPTSSVFSIGTADGVNKNTSTIICYTFAPVQGFSKAGTYEGNGNADGPFLWCGFRPAWVMMKAVDRADDWFILDNKRETYNPRTTRLQPNKTNAEDSVASLATDFVSNGFKLRGATAQYNTADETYVYMAFAEAPFVNSNGVPCNAR